MRTRSCFSSSVTHRMNYMGENQYRFRSLLRWIVAVMYLVTSCDDLERMFDRYNRDASNLSNRNECHDSAIAFGWIGREADALVVATQIQCTTDERMKVSRQPTGCYKSSERSQVLLHTEKLHASTVDGSSCSYQRVRHRHQHTGV